jgi:hypothetical protein
MGYLIAYLLGIVSALKPSKKSVNSIPPNAEPADENQCRKPLVFFRTKIPPSPQSSAQSGQCCYHKTPWWKAVLETLTFVAAVGAAVATGIYAHITSQMWGEMQQQTALLKRQTEASLQAIITKQFRLTWPEKRAYLSVILDNRGKVIASDISANLKLFKVSLPDRKVMANLPDWRIDHPQILPSPDLPIEKGIYVDVSQEELTGHQGMPRGIKIMGDFTYLNGFSVVSYPICIYVLGSVEFRDKSGVVKQSSGPFVVTCDSLTPQIAYYIETGKSIAQQKQQPRHGN